MPRKCPTNNTSGVLGISATYALGRGAGDERYPIPCLDVTYTVDGMRKSKRFYFSHYGSDRECWDAAREFRREHENGN